MQETNIPKTYDPQSFEKKWYKFWEDNRLFHVEVEKGKKPYSIVIPPPNVTGQLHMGHAMDNTLQDILIRFRRMQGYNTLWMPGCDHAGIATQAKVDAQLAKEGTSRHEIGRKKFVERAWQWKKKYGDRIMYQLRSMGSSCDWERECFTMDEGCSRAVREVFVQLYEDGLIYQGKRITNWCPHCNTALSDIEVEHKTQMGHLYHIRYKMADDDNSYIEIATTRPETMFGDTAIAVHPNDERYKDVVGKNVIVPIVGRKIEIIADDYVDKEFGTGAVKITPAHDPNDFDMGQRHNLDQILVMTSEGKMAENTGKYVGMDRYACRKQLIVDLKEQGFLVNIEDHEHAVGHCSRCGTTVEPMVSKQWFVKMETLAKPAIEAVKSGKIKFVPERFTKIYCNWLENIRDWCISRQLWWGHQIPAWYCDDCGETIVARNDVTICPRCGGNHLHRDEDVLDTWFSSGLWPFETMGWPESTEELKQFYPTSVLVTGYDIIFFWVARMVMMGLKFCNDIPFKHVFIHGLVRDSEGRKMSKSLGNGIDPVEVIEKYGADTLRFMLITGNTPGNDMRFYWERVESARNFANKLWNASRFMLMNLEDFDKDFVPQKEDCTLADNWILSRYAHTVEQVTANLENFELGEAARVLYEFIWNEFCDWYIELTKPYLYEGKSTVHKKTAQYILDYVLEHTLRLLHPFMPFITEEIWQHIPHDGKSIMIAPWPSNESARIDDAAEKNMTAIMETVKAIRNIRAQVNAIPGKKSEVILYFTDKDLIKVFAENKDYLAVLAAAQPMTIWKDDQNKPQNAMTAVVDGIQIYMPMAGLIDVVKETARLTKEKANLTKEINRLSKKLNNKAFLTKAPVQVVKKEKEKQKGYEDKQKAVEERLAYLTTLREK